MFARRILLPCVVVIAAAVADAQVTAWSYTVPGPYPEHAAAVVVGPDGSFYSGFGLQRGGATDVDWAIYKYSNSGALVWTKYFGALQGLGATDDLADLLIDGNGNLYGVGYTQVFDGQFNQKRMTVIKINTANGDEDWRASVPYDNSTGLFIEADGAGNVYAAGQTATNAKYLLTKIVAATGSSVWTAELDPSNGTDILRKIAVTAVGNTYLVGSTAQSQNMYYACLDTDKNTLFSGSYGGSQAEDYASSCVVDPTTNAFYICGTVTTGSTKNIALWRLNATNGAQAWVRTYNGAASGIDEGIDVIRDGTSNTIFLAGRSQRPNEGFDIRYARYDANGNQLWERFYSGSAARDDFPVQAIQDGTSNTILVGEQIGSNGRDLCILKYSNTGVLLCSRAYDENGLGQGASCVVRDAGGSLFIGGYTDREPSPQDDYFVGKFVQLNLTVPSLLSGDTKNGTVSVSSAAPGPNGFTFDLASDSPSIQVPALTTIAAGAGSSSFSINVLPFSASHTVTITASAQTGGSISQTILAQGPYPDSLSINPSSVTGGASTEASLSLAGALPDEGVMVSVVDNSTAVLSPAFINAGSTDEVEIFYIGTRPVGASAVRQVRASANGFTVTANITLLPATLVSLTLNPTSVPGGTSSTGTVTVNGPSSGQSVALSDNSSILSVPASVFIPANQSTASFTVSTTTVSSTATRQVLATLNGVTKTANLTVTTGVGLQSLSISPSSIQGGDSATGTVTLSGPATGFTAVTLSDNSSAIQTPSSVTYESGNPPAKTFQITTSTVTSTSTRQVTATYQSVSRTATLTLTP